VDRDAEGDAQRGGGAPSLLGNGSAGSSVSSPPEKKWNFSISEIECFGVFCGAKFAVLSLYTLNFGGSALLYRVARVGHRSFLLIPWSDSCCLALALCLRWYNELITQRVYSSQVKKVGYLL